MNRWSTVIDNNIVATAAFKNIELCPDQASDWNVTTLCGKSSLTQYYQCLLMKIIILFCFSS